MPQRSVVAVGASLLVASLALAGCGTRGDSGDDASGSGSSENKVAKIGVIAPLSGDLAALGLAPEDIDYVMCTHLHGDHIGWNTRLLDGRWVPTFPKARYVMSRA